MRLKNVPGAQDVIEASEFVCHDPESCFGRWKELFGNDRPIELEIGIGKGKFLFDIAGRCPEKNFLGIEMYSSVLCRAIQNAEQRVTGSELHLSVSEKERPHRPSDCNFRLIRYDATGITSLFAPGEIGKIYLNFSDPWPKDRHADRRLTSARFLARYEKILPGGGEVFFKTDNTDLFEFSVEQFRERGWDITYVTRDLHLSGGRPDENAGSRLRNISAPESAADADLLSKHILTEYEEKFIAAGKPICMLAAIAP